MNWSNLIVMIGVFVGYSILVFGLSSIFLRPVLKGKRFSTGFLACFLAGNFYIMNVVFFLLLFFHCESRLITILVLISGAVLLRLLLSRKNIKIDGYAAWDKLQKLIAGTYGWHLFFKEQVRRMFGNLLKGLWFILARHQAEIVGVLVCLLLQAYYTGYRLVMYSSYGGYDEVVHSRWIQEMMGGEIYSAGVYPFGFHEMVYAVAKIFGMHAPQVVRNFGIIITVYMTLMLYCLIADVLDSRVAAFLATFMYAGVNIYLQTAWDRIGFGYPQEFGAIFLYPMMIFLLLYFKEKKKFYLVFFGMAFSLTLYVHYYITIIALVFCLAVGVVYLVYMCRKKLLVPILICGILASLTGAATMVLGVVMGHPLQGSLYWALGVISGEGDDEEEVTQEELPVDEETAVGDEVSPEGTAPEDGVVSGGSLGISEAGSGNDSEGALGTDTAGDGQTSLKEKIGQLCAGGKQLVLKLYNCIHNARRYNCMTENSFRMFSIFSVCSLILGLYYLIPGRKPFRGAFILAFLFYIFLLDILMASSELGLPTLIENYRVRVFVCYALPFVLAVPANFVLEILERFYGSEDVTEAGMILRRVAMIPLIIFSVITLYRYDLSRYPGRTTVIQADSVVDVFYKILDEYEGKNWTLVSDVQEYAMCLGSGQHYEWTELLQKLSSGITDIKIPTEYVFFAIEKRPIIYGTIIENGSDVPFLGSVSRDFAKMGFSYGADYAYREQRLQVMSKAYYWAEAYAEMFPDEMTVYYEDEDVIYYRLKQEPYYLNNLKIDYGYNSIEGNQP